MLPHPQPCHQGCRAQEQGKRVQGNASSDLRALLQNGRSHMKHVQKILLICINLSSLAILLSAQPEVGQIETFEYKQPLEQLPLLDVLVGDVALRGETPEGVSQTE